ncbi:hypothetical protein HU200_048270 [Digitaria exilis]|uniref:F-box domain-containing protein n=1 Tax=Digitaria exilis TaxID=1010633 RepID=A0A835B211_9POAL|nr:hypothetical protein HU200_048270 [Digitaria exilis]
MTSHRSVTCGSIIPDDILVFQILVLLPLKCLVRFQSVCKSWRATILSSRFARRHMELNKNTSSSIFLLPRKYQKDLIRVGIRGVHIYRFQPGHSKVAELILERNFANGIPIFSNPLQCDGLILIPCATGRVFVCNPATREFVELPPGCQNHNMVLDSRAALGFDPRSGMYKVARPFLRSYGVTQTNGGGKVTYCSIGYETLTLGCGKEAWKWKVTMDPPYPIMSRSPICLPGFFYWGAVKSMTDHDNDKVGSSDVILRYSLWDETFTVHDNLPCRGTLSINDALCELGGKLCYVHSASPLEVSIWLAEEGPNFAWSLCCCVSLPIPRHHRVLACPSANKDKIFLSIDAFYLLKCDLRDGSFEVIINMAQDLVYDDRKGVKFTSGALPFAHYMVPYVESLLRIRPF